MPMIDIIGMGMGEHDLTPAHRKTIEKADLLVGEAVILKFSRGLKKKV